MKPPTSIRRVAWLALFVVAPAVSGPGAIVVTLATLASFGGDTSHHVSIQQDLGHDDFVFCHDSRDGADSASAIFAAVDCADDHRLHAANAESLVSRHDVARLLYDAPFVAVASTLVAIATPVRASIPVSDAAPRVAIRHHRTIVLRV
jgi:hypothetical protein